jgi:hypothetical protein
MDISAHSALVRKWPRSLIIRTTLYDLIAAINAEVGADEEDLAIAAVVHLLRTHRLTYLGTAEPRQLGNDQSQVLRRRKAAIAARSGWIANGACRALPPRAWSSARYLPPVRPQRPPANA